MSGDHWGPSLEAATRALEVGVWRLDFSADVASWNPVATELLQCASPEPTRTFVSKLEAGLEDGELPAWSEDETWASGPIRFSGPEGRRYLRFAGRREGHVWQGAMLDVTHERMLRLRLAAAERLEAIGRFSAGVAHNFNNMLTIIVACLEDAQTRLTHQAHGDDGVLRDIIDAQQAAHRAKVVVGDLRGLAHSYDNERSELCEVHKLCEEAVEGLRRVAVDGLEFMHSVPAGLWVRQSPGMLEQVLSNLLVNANHAVAGRKSPTIWLRGTGEEVLGVPTLELIVSDNGEGVPADIEPVLFQPFVTSKGKDGTGLGLATSAESLRQVNGQIAYRAREGGGAEFVVLLPLSSPPETSESETRPAMKPPKQTHKTADGDLCGRQVLLVDDEPIIQRLVKRILQQAGASVTTVGDLASARTALDSRYDVVLLDRTLGHERGIELLPDVRANSPGAQVLFFSGDPVGAAEMALVDAMVPKPVGRAALISAVSEALSRAQNKRS
ncbi:MAG: ATP-binding protein [Nannocystales bacterium]